MDFEIEKLLKKHRAPDPIVIKREWDRDMLRVLNAKPIEDLHLLKKTEEFAKRLGIKTPLIYVAEEFPAICGGKMPNAAAYVLNAPPHIPNAIAFTRQQFTMHNYHLNSGAQIPSEVLFTLGHEMGHVKQSGKYLEAVRRYPWMMGMAGAVAGLYLYNNAFHRCTEKCKGKKPSDKDLETASDQVLQEEREKIKNLGGKTESHGPLEAIRANLNAVLNAGAYWKAAIIGGLGGKFLTRQFMLNAEFDADKVGAELCGDPRAGIRSFKASREYCDKHPEEMEKLMENIGIKDIFESLFDSAHPADEARFTHLEAMAKHMERGAEKVVGNAKTTLGVILEHTPSILTKIRKSAINPLARMI